MYLHKTPYLLRALYPSLTWNKSRNEKKLYLTFDDGPIPEVTEFVLGQLLKYKAKATFFCVGENIYNHPEIFQKIIASGNSIGNHTYNHLNGWKEEDGSYVKNVTKCEEVINRFCPDRKKMLFRPPYGKVSSSQRRHLTKEFEIVMWDVLSGDFDRSLDPKVCLKNTIRATKNGSIIIFHDSIKSAQNLYFALPGFLKHFSAKGFEFAPL